MKLMKRLARGTLRSMGYSVIRTQVLPEQYRFSGEYTDLSDVAPRISCEPGEPTWYAATPVVFTVDNGRSVVRQEVLYSSLTLLKMLKHFEFETVLDIGSHAGNVARVFAHLGKKVTTCEISPGYEADYKGDYLEVQFPSQFDAIWCSQTLEHQRNVGLFLTKIFDDLREGGVLALTVPYEVSSTLSFGHCNHFTPLLLIYQLVMAGFCCRDICLCRYDGNIGIVLRKKFNGINRALPHGTLAVNEATSGTAVINGKTWNVRELLGQEVFDGMRAAFPPEITLKHSGTSWNEPSINWGQPI